MMHRRIRRCYILVAITAAIITATALVVANVSGGGGGGADDETRRRSSLLEPWQECSMFVAPSPTGGYGVFAARDFQENEIVELASFFLPAEKDIPFIFNTALQDYIYGYLREPPPPEPPHFMSVIVWGMTMMYNHHAESPNLKWVSFGREPSIPNEPHNVRAVGFQASRPIRKGEELFSTYGSEDGGAKWFNDRHLTMTTSPESTKLPDDQLEQIQQLYCSKMYADIDDYVYTQRLQPVIDPSITFYHPSRLAPSLMVHRNIHDYDDPDFPWALAKVPIAKGDRIELAPALVLDRDLVIHTPLASLVYYWDDLNDELQSSVRALRRLGYYVVQYQGASNEWHREDHFRSFEESVILPVGGWIGRVQRVGEDYDDNNKNSIDANAANSYLRILPSDFHNTTALTARAADAAAAAAAAAQQEALQEKTKEHNPFALGNAGIVLELVASRDIAVGERIRVNVPPAGTFKERLALYMEMERSGQIYTAVDHYDHLFQLDEPEREQESEQQEQQSDGDTEDETQPIQAIDSTRNDEL